MASQPQSVSDQPRPSLSDLVAKFTTQQIYEFREAFNLMDQNRDGFIDVEDLEDIHGCVGEMPSDSELLKMLNEVSCPVNFSAFLSLMGQNLSGYDSAESMEQAFSMFDPEGKGFISEKYLQQLLQTMGDNLTPEEIQQAWEQIPVNDGKVDYRRFVSIMTGSGEGQ